jgi:small GTP-binding protein
MFLNETVYSEKENNNNENTFRVLLLGDSSVGKTCILLRYDDETFTENHISTIGVDYITKIIETENVYLKDNKELDNKNKNKNIKLQIWDTAGQDKFRCITKNYFRGSNGIMLIFDITNPLSLKNIKNWVNQIRESLSDEVCITLIGNKSDLDNKRIINFEDAEKIAKDFNMDYYETSAKMNINIKEAFKNLMEKMLNKYNEKLEKEKEDKNLRKRNESIKISRYSKYNDDDKGKKKKFFFC